MTLTRHRHRSVNEARIRFAVMKSFAAIKKGGPEGPPFRVAFLAVLRGQNKEPIGPKHHRSPTKQGKIRQYPCMFGAHITVFQTQIL
jgi:hypothetical protein